MLHAIVAIVCLLPLLAAVAVAADAPPVAPPVAPLKPVVDEFFGVKVSDPYRYMENFADPQVQAWVKGQGEYAKSVLASIPGREALLKRIQELDEAAPYRIHVVRRWPNGDLHYLKRLASENLDKLYFRDAAGKEKLLVDPDQYAAGPGKHASISVARPSPSGRFVAFGIAASGSEQTTLHILDTQSGKNLSETIDRLEHDYLEPSWLPDETGFVYSRRRKLADDAPDTEHYIDTYACLHKLGTDVEKDPVIFSRTATPSAGISAADFPAVSLAFGSRYAIGQVKHGDAREMTLFVAPIESLTQPAVPWKQLCGRSDEVEEYALHGDEVFLRTANDAPTYRVIRVTLPGDFAGGVTVVPVGTPVVHGIEAGKDALYIGLLDSGVNRVLRMGYEKGAKIEPVPTPGRAPSAHFSGVAPDLEGAFISTASWTKGGSIYAFDPKTGQSKETDLRPAGKFDDVPGYESIEVMVPSHDGVKIPLSIVFKSGIKLDGSHPTLVNGYGAYGMTMSPRFNPAALAWLERGGVMAFAHVRGGGAFGKPWHLAGQKQTKPNTWKDFIACCEYLVKQGYTSPGKLAGQGGSAGGILIGRSITERPDLFAAAIINVGCVDAIRMETTANGIPNIQEFGTVANEAGFRALLEMSAFASVKDGTKYPAVLLTHGVNDPRVEPWMSAKMTARLQAANSSGKPVLFRVDYDAGHGIGSTKKQYQELKADEWAFLLWQMGEK